MSGFLDAQHFGVEAPRVVYRVSRSTHAPMSLPPILTQGTGRFDDIRDSNHGIEPKYGVLYCGVNELTAFIEVLSVHRLDLSTVGGVEQQTIMDVDDRDESRRLVQLAKDAVFKNWINTRVLTSGTLSTSAPIFNLADARAVQFVREELSISLLAMGIHDLDFSHVLSDNRDLTRAISRWIWTMTNKAGEPLFSGIRYRSRFDPECICVAFYQDRYSVDGDVTIQPITLETPGFAEAASILRLKIT